MDVTSAEFQTAVVDRSRQRPVLVDFWAAWCGPCRMLGPVLEKLAAEPEARFDLVKVDIDANQDLAAQHRVSSIPAVKLFVDGKLAAEFLGALPESSVRQFLADHLPSEADKLVFAGDYQGALALDPNHAGAHLALAKQCLAGGDIPRARTHLEAVDPRSDEAETARSLAELIDLIQIGADAGGVAACRATVEAAPKDAAAHYRLGCALIGTGDYRAALEQFLEVVRRDKKYDDEAGRKAMLKIFAAIGIRSPLSDEFRNELAMLL